MTLILFFIFFFPTALKSIACGDIYDEQVCNSKTRCLWKQSQSKRESGCKCASEMPIDIIFGIDKSGSIGEKEFSHQLGFLEDLITGQVNFNRARIGFVEFSTSVSTTDIRFWNETGLRNFIRNIHYENGWTNTGQAMQDALKLFKKTRSYDRSEILIMITDGNPCLPWGNCNWERCGCGETRRDRSGMKGGICDIILPYYRQDRAQGNNIQIVFLGIGAGFTRSFIECLVEDPQKDIIDSLDYQSVNLAATIPQLQVFTCPITTGSPSKSPSSSPFLPPTVSPSNFPSQKPTLSPTLSSLSPSNTPSVTPSASPTKITPSPTSSPTRITNSPTSNPTLHPSVSPTKSTRYPSNSPTKTPTKKTK